MNLSKSQIKQITNFINLKEVKQYIEENRDDYEKWLKEEENKRIIKIYTRYRILETIDKSSLKIRKIYKTNNYNYTICNCYTA